MRLLERKVVIITGAGRGVGKAEALALAKHGARVLVNDSGCNLEGEGADHTVAAEVACEIERSGGHAISDCTDITGPETPQALIDRARSHFGRLDAVILNAGILRERTLLSHDPRDLDRVIDVSIRATFAMAKRATRAMIEQGNGGCLLLTASPLGFYGGVRQSLAAAASAAVVGLARSAAAELRRHGIRVNVIAPTARTRMTEETPLFQSVSPEAMTPEPVAQVAAFLLSDAAEGISGEVVGVAGQRVYTLRASESPGAFFEGAELDATILRSRWNEISALR